VRARPLEKAIKTMPDYLRLNLDGLLTEAAFKR
jgi:hypothetical protein